MFAFSAALLAVVPVVAAVVAPDVVPVVAVVVVWTVLAGNPRPTYVWMMLFAVF
jgi:hypothetical protein